MIYCLENDKDFSIGSGHTGVDGLTQDGNTSGTHAEKVWYGLSSDQRMAIGLILLYGAPNQWWDEDWGFNASGDWNKHNPNIGYRFATQALIWEIVCDMRDPTPPYERTSTYWYSRSTGVCMSEDGSVDHFVEAYDGIVESLQLHNTIPSFTGDFLATAPEIEITGNQITVTDTNKVLSRFEFTDTGTVSYTKKGNDLTIKTSGAVPTDVQSAIAELPDPTASIYETWYNSFDSSKQVCIRVSLPASDPVPAYFKLKASAGALDLAKTTEDGKNLSGWQFSIYSDSACTKLLSGPHTTNSKGKLSVEGLTAGTVWVKEVGHEDSDVEAKYVCDSTNPQKVTIKAGETAKVTFNNDLKRGTAKIVKKATNGGTVKGWTFTIKDSSGTEVGTYTTDDTGIITQDLLPGKYTVTETNAAKTYWVNDPTSTRTVTVTAGKTATVTFTNQYNGRAKIVKKATNGGTVEGWHFDVKDASGNLVGSYETNSAGTIVVDLEPGTYAVTETDAAKTYWVNDPTSTRTVTVTAGKTATVTFTNQYNGRAKIVKKATNGGSVQGWEFTVTDADGNKVGTYTTNSKGTITVDLEPGTYTVTETARDDPYWYCDTSPQTVTVTAGKTATVTFQNQWIGKTKIIKVLDNPEAGSVEGWQFRIDRITDSGTEQIATVTTGADGTILQDLEPGQYRITELLEENSLWQCTTGLSQDITVEAGATAEVSFTNALRPGEISIQKVDTSGEPLAGAKFLLEWSEDGNNWNPVVYSDSTVVVKGGCSNPDVVDGTLVTPESGLITWGNLYPTLQYRITELEAPEGFLLLKDPAFDGELPVDDLTVTLRVVNSEAFALPKTGSNSLLLMPIGIALCAAVCLGTILFLRKKEQ